LLFVVLSFSASALNLALVLEKPNFLSTGFLNFGKSLKRCLSASCNAFLPEITGGQFLKSPVELP
jgi:hypothetical protein